MPTTINDAMSAATDQATHSAAMALWFSKTSTESIQDAERRWLLALPATTIGANQDLWMQYLGSLGYTGALNDRLLAYWSNPIAFATAFDSDYDAAYDYLTRATTRYCPVYHSAGANRYALLPANEAPRHGWRQWENLAASSDTPTTQNITVVSGHIYTVTIGADSASGATAICSGAFTGTLTGNAVDRLTLGAKTAATTTLTITISGSVKYLQVEDQTSLPAADQGIPNPYVSSTDVIGWSRYANGSSVASNVVTEALGELIPGNEQGEVDGYAPIGAELVTNGTFDTDLTGWTIANNDVNNTITFNNGSIDIVSDGTLPLNMSQGAVFTTGVPHILTIDVIANAGNAVGIKLQYTGADSSIGVINSTGSFSFSFTPDNTTLEIFRKGAGNTDMTIDNVSVREAHPVRKDYAPEPAYTNAIPFHKDLTNVAWTKTNMTNAYDALGVDGTPTGGTTLTAAAANATAIHSAVTAVSGTHSTKWYITRTTGTGTIELTTDNGTTWQNITTSVSTTMAGIAVDQAAVTNPQIGIRIVTSGDAVTVQQAELFLATAKAVVKHASPIPDGSGATFTKDADVFQSAALGALFPQAAGACLAKWRPSWNAADVTGINALIVGITNASTGVLYADTSASIKTADGTLFVVKLVSFAELTQYDLASYWGSGLNVVADQVAGTEVAYDGAFASDGTFRLHYAIAYPMYFSSVEIYRPQPSVAFIQGQQG